MADIRAQYDELAQKNREELDKYWSQQIEESTTIVTSQLAEVSAAETTLTELRRTFQSLEIDLESMKNLKISLRTACGTWRRATPCRWSSSTVCCCTWSPSWRRPGPRDSARPRSTRPC